MELILVMETRPSCKSDYRYIKSTIDYFYCSRQFQIKPIFAKCKGELIKQDKKIAEEMKRYGDKCVAVICTDYDSSSDPNNQKIENYCKEKGFDLIWMNRNVEEVYLGKMKIKSKDQASKDFLRHQNAFFSMAKNLDEINPLVHTCSTNIKTIFDKYLQKKT